ncbi:MAG: hypothetical protein GXO02_06185 [Epsilonproteobacteria bacterium]|nr:hypothetical protein [Campylobacterota bacterium]
MKSLLVKTHELWLVTLMASFMSKRLETKRNLNDFSDIIFRHFTWIEKELIKKNIPYDYNREVVPIKVDRLKIILQNINDRINTILFTLDLLENKELKDRIKSDLEYIKFVVEKIEDEDVSSAFNAKRVYKDYKLSPEATDAFTLFLFEESYKEYELIMVYNYLKAHSNDDFLNKIFQILVEESFFHLKSFGEMMANMGILAVPRVIHKSIYQVENIIKFLEDGIDEEIAAKEECVKLSEAVAKDSKELAKFFEFINNQENYHIALMKDALNYYSRKENNE